MKWVALIYAAEWISAGFGGVNRNQRHRKSESALVFLIPALFGVSYHDGDEGEKK